MADEPLVHTTKGNLPASLLDEACEWEVGPGYVVCKPTWRLKATGEVVKRSCHVLQTAGAAAAGEQATL